MRVLSLRKAFVLLITFAFSAEAVMVSMTKFTYVAVCSVEDSIEIAGYFKVRDETSCSFMCSSAMPACQSFVYWKRTSYCSLKDSTIINMTITGCPEESMQIYGEPTTEFLPRQGNKLRCGGGGCTTSINNFRLCDGGGTGVCDVMQGRLEVYYNDQWGSVCDDGFSTPEATVACKMFGYSVGYSQCCAYFNQAPSSYPIWLDNIDCTGSEALLDECYHQAWGSHNCGHSEDQSVICE